MATKRLRDSFDQDDADEQPVAKQTRRLPSFSTVIKEAMMQKSLKNMFLVLEPLFRRVVREELDRVLVQSMLFLPRQEINSACRTQLPEPKSNQMQIEAPESPRMKLIFKRPPLLPIFTGSKIEDVDNKPLQVLIVDGNNEEVIIPAFKLEVVVLDGDFPAGEGEDWTSTAFQNSILKERPGKRPLITGDVSVILRDGTASICDLSFTDNSSWIRSRHFRIGVRVVPGRGIMPRIKEAVTQAFTVRDHRGELYKKHYPPALEDEVWRLENIGKDGIFHKRLSADNINTVHDFLKLSNVNQERLRQILGTSMSDRKWEVTISHARTCQTGDKLYLCIGEQCIIFLNPICEVVRILFGSTEVTLQDLNKSERMYVHQLVQEAYQNWDVLEEAEGLLNYSNTQLTQDARIPQSGIEPLSWCPFQQETATMPGYQLGGYNDAFFQSPLGGYGCN